VVNPREEMRAGTPQSQAAAFNGLKETPASNNAGMMDPGGAADAAPGLERMPTTSGITPTAGAPVYSFTVAPAVFH